MSDMSLDSMTTQNDDSPGVVAFIHSPALQAREEHLKSLCTMFGGCGASVVIVTGPEPPMTDPAQLSSIVNMDSVSLQGAGNAQVADVFKTLLQDMKVRQLSNALKHAAAMQHIAALPNYSDASWHMILEDDAMVSDPSRLLAACASAPADADMLFFGLPTMLPHPVGGAIRYDLLDGIKLLPACEAYAVRLRTARFLAPCVLPIRFRTEIHLSWLIATTKTRTYLTSPNLSLDGSKMGVYVSTIENNNTLRFNADYMKLAEAMDKVPTDDEMDEIVVRVQEMPFGAHPDVQVLLGRRLAAAGRHAAARDVFKRALEVYTSEGGVVGMESLFMGVYMDLFKYSQDDLMVLTLPSSIQV